MRWLLREDRGKGEGEHLMLWYGSFFFEKQNKTKKKHICIIVALVPSKKSMNNYHTNCSRNDKVSADL
jgi:hypothetical protein